MDDWLRKSLTEISAGLHAGRISAVELMRAVLARIDGVNPHLNAVVAERERAAILAEAASAEERLRRGEGRTLEGVPFAVKDLENVAGMVTSFGSRAYRDNVAGRDSLQVERLRAAGGIVVGKTNTPEFGATAITKNPLFGATRNPWQYERTPGGSSGGSAAAIAAGLLPLATASDGGGSIRIPASFTGCFGLKPSYGRVPRGPEPLWVMGDTSVWGPLTRSVEDAALLLDVVAGTHPLDPNSLPRPALSYREILPRRPEDLRCAYSPDLGYAVVQSDVAEVAARASRTFSGFGCEVEELAGGPPNMAYDWGLVGAFELYGEVEAVVAERETEFGRGFLKSIAAGREMTPAIWTAARRRRAELNQWCADVFARFDLLLTPTVPYDPPPVKGPFPEEVEGRPQPLGGVGSFTIPFNLSWHPAATVRAGYSRAGLPVGLQIVGPRHRDDLVLQAAYAFEQACPWNDRWPTV